MIIDLWSSILAFSLGLGLAAACGFRAFLPPLLLGICSRADLITLGDSWQWLSSTWVIILLAIAAIFEICAYFIPWLDNLLDTLATPVAIIAGTTLTCAALDGIDPALQWILALISGVGLTGSIQLSTVTIRGLSTATTAGIGNPLVTIVEDFMSLLLIVLSIFLPLLAVALLIIFILLMKNLIQKLRKKKRLRSAEG